MFLPKSTLFIYYVECNFDSCKQQTHDVSVTWLSQGWPWPYISAVFSHANPQQVAIVVLQEWVSWPITRRLIKPLSCSPLSVAKKNIWIADHFFVELGSFPVGCEDFSAPGGITNGVPVWGDPLQYQLWGFCATSGKPRRSKTKLNVQSFCRPCDNV